MIPYKRKKNCLCIIQLVNIISRNYQLIKANETIDFKELKIKFRYSLNF